MSVIGLDTSNYTTSIACFDGVDGVNCSRLLPVKAGQLGLRQSDAVFHHIQGLPELSGRLFSRVRAEEITAVAVSTRPRAVEGSYMPCFTVGISHAKMLSSLLRVPLFAVSHQQGHVAACLWSAGRLELMDRPHLAWHLSGGTTELLLVEPEGKNVRCTRIGGTMDISAGQLIDRTGQLLGQPFPAGKRLDALKQASECTQRFCVKCQGLEFSLSGVQNQVERFAQTHSPEDTAAFALGSICFAVGRATENARQQYSDYAVVFSGGVASNGLLRREMARFDPVFCAPEFSTDNAMGVAVLAHRLQEG